MTTKYKITLRKTIESHLLGEEIDIRGVTYAISREGKIDSSLSPSLDDAILKYVERYPKLPSEVTLEIKASK